ncbi:flavin reductase [Butyrivibrio sp. AE2032]|uniref:flavin reductase n=1 Tax=Butyrivibrio sp. AE2032 TaxID=1458463 RepID=UPI00054FFBCC|nr:flavin reductase [Butyrivibrio sp. AE2032]
MPIHVFQPVNPEEVDEGPFTFDGGKMLVTAANGDKVNSTACSWGCVGYLWGKRVVIVYVRSSRYTKEFLDASGEFSISFLNKNDYRGALKYMEAVSGRDEDKIAGARLNVNYYEGIPFIDEADNVITCRVLYKQLYEKEGFIDDSIVDEVYKDGDYHYMYIGEITKILVR